MHLSICTTNKNADVTSVQNVPPGTHSSIPFPSYAPIYIVEIEQAEQVNRPDQDSFLLTPTGLIIRRIWITGALTSYESSRQGNTIRIADTTGVLSVIIKPHVLENIDPSDLVPPLFVSITASIEKITGSNPPSYRWVADSCRIVTRQDRDTWIITTATSLLERLQEMSNLIQTGTGSESLLQAQIQFHTQKQHLKIFAEHANKALNVIKEPGPAVPPSELIISIIKEYSGPRGIHMDDIYKYTRRAALDDNLVRDTIRTLVADDEVYQPSPGYVKLL